MKSGLVLASSAITAAAAAAVVSANPFAPPERQNSAREAYTSTLMEKARPKSARFGPGVRRNEANGGIADTVDTMSEYSLRFEECLLIQTYDDEWADSKFESLLETRHLAVFRLCPSGDDCDDSCESNFGEYVVELQDYLEQTIEYQRKMQLEMCEACETCDSFDSSYKNNNNNGDDGFSNNDDIDTEEEESASLGEIEAVSLRSVNGGEGGFRPFPNPGVDCETCVMECGMIENMEDNGYIDATVLIPCQMIYDDGGKGVLYAGPMCASNGSKINIGVFTDEYCSVPDPGKNVEDYLMNDKGARMKLSHGLLKTVYSGDCISCRDLQEEIEVDDEEPRVLEMCENLHYIADTAKCEHETGFDREDTHPSDSPSGCDFISSLKNPGDFLIDSTDAATLVGEGGLATIEQDVMVGQQFAISFFVVGAIVLALYAVALWKATNPSTEPSGRAHERGTR